MTLLDKLPDSEWFFCLALYLAVYCIAALGVIHILFWVKVMHVYRSELFVFMYVLIIFWSILSAALLYAIVVESHCIYAFWIWYTMVFCVAMAALMFLLFCGFCVLGMRRKSIVVLIGLLYYLVTLYCVLVVNKQRILVFGLNAKCGSCAIRHAYDYAGPTSTQGNTGYPVPSAPLLSPQYSQYSQYSQYTVHPTMRQDLAQPQEFYATAMAIMAPALSMAAPFLSIPTPVPAVPAPVPTMPVPVPTAPAPVPAIPVSIMTIAAAALPVSASVPTIPPSALIANVTEARKMLSPTMPYGLDEDTYAVPDKDRQTRMLQEFLTSKATSDRDAAVAMLSELLVTSNECRKPRKPSHGRFQVVGRRGKTALKLILHCEPGYRANSLDTQCKYNWWDKPIPQCRVRKPPDPLPLPGGGCLMPGYPQHGEYRVAGHERARPGDRVAGDNIVLLVTCDEPYRAVDPYVVCVEGRWRHGAPQCLKHCKLNFDLSVEYKCLKEFRDDFVECSAWQPDGAVVSASCRPGLAHRGPFRYMRCHGDTWDHTVGCVPNANFTT